MTQEADQSIRRREEQEAAQDLPFDADHDASPAGVEGKLDVTPGPGGYAGRDAETDMPRVPSAPATQDDAPEE